MPAIEVSGLVIRYRDVIAVDGLDLQAERGEVVALLGRNGAGKTSTVEALEGYRKATAGRLRVLGLDPQHPPEQRKLTRRIGVMLQSGGVYPGMSPEEAVRLFASYYEQPRDPGELLDRLGLVGPVARTPWRRLSGGEQQRLSLALALVGRPAVAFLDEPTSGVDPQGRVTIREVITDLRSEGASVIVTTHELDEAERIADKVVIIDKGKILASGSLADLTGQGSSLRFSAAPGLDSAALSTHLRLEVTEFRPGSYRVDLDNEQAMPSTVALLTAWLAEREIVIQDLRAGGETLEEMFLRVTGDGQ